MLGRCFGDGDPLYAAYHDLEWGRPVLGEQGLYEHICLEAFQAGLAWRLVLVRRDLLRQALGGFDPERVANFGASDVVRALDAPGMIRHRAKVEAAVQNARATLALRASGRPLPGLLWAHRPERAGLPPETPPPSRTAESAALARALRAAGFCFIGPTNAYALMQGAGLVNDHGVGCPVRAEVESAQRAAVERLRRQAVPAITPPPR